MTGQQMRALRLGLRLTQAAFASRIGRSTRQVNGYEAGDLPISLTVALACAAVAHGLEADAA